MKRLHQVLLIGTFLPLCWLAMMAVHELRACRRRLPLAARSNESSFIR